MKSTLQRLPSSPTPAPTTDRSGFALVLSLLLMAFVVLLLLAMSSLVSVEMKSSDLQKKENKARQIALLGVHVALGELQKTMGPDQRISARAELLDQDPSTLVIEGVQNPYWTGVWTLIDPDDARTVEFDRWLVSGDPTTNEQVTAPETAPVDGIELVSDRSTDGSGSSVTAALVPVDVGGAGAGRFAYWIGDEGVKAKLSSAEPYPANFDPTTDIPQHLAWLRQPGNLNLAGSAYFDRNQIEANIATFETVRRKNLLIDGAVGLQAFMASPASGVVPAPRHLFHDFTTHGYSVLSDTRLGGLQKDLTAALVYDDQMPTGKIVERDEVYVTMPEPDWALLKSFVDLRNETAGSNLPTLSARSQTDTVQGVAPLLAYLRMDYFAWYEATTDPVTDTTENHLWFGFNPVVIMVNPYDVSLSIDNFTLSFGDEWATKLENIKIEGAVDSGLGPQIELSEFVRPPKVFKFANQVFEPGEVLIFSPASETRAAADQFLVDSNPFDAANDFEKGYIEGFVGYQSDTGLVLGGPNATGAFDLNRADSGDSIFVVPGLYDNGNPKYTSANVGGNDNDEGKLFVDIRLEDKQDRVAYFYEGVKIYQNENNPSGLYAYKNPSFKSKQVSQGPTLIASVTLSKSGAYKTTTFGGQPMALPFAARSLRAPKESKFRSSFTVESSLNDGKNLGMIYQDVANDRSVFGMRINEDNAVGKVVDTRTVFFHVPRASPQSVADLRHANLIPQTDGGDAVRTNNYPIASSFVNHDLESDTRDFTYRLNELLWDRYFFSTYDAIAGVLMNKALTHYDNPDAGDLKSFDRSATKLLLNGGFNVNSTSTEAWAALLGALSERKVLRYNQTTLEPEIADAAHPFFRSILPLGEALASSDDPESDPNVSNFFSYRELTGDEIDYLAHGIVKRLKVRGKPFPTLGAFVNRSLSPGGENDVAYALGIIQETIEAVEAPDPSNPDDRANTLNRNFLAGLRNFDKGSGNEVITREDDLADKGVFWSLEPNKPFSKATEGFFKGTGAPGYLMQGDILQAIGSQLRPRSDTFVIRTYGEVLDSVTGRAEAHAMCEVVVQRLPTWVNASDNPADAEAALLTPANRAFGRRFEIISLRWLNHDDI
jgi:hypothetical protein